MAQPTASASSLRRRLPGALVTACVSAGLLAVVPNVGAAPPARSYAVATESAGATREATRVLAAGGNAFDAAVCAALVAGFTDPASSGIGGGGFAMVWSARDKRAYVFDFREAAPAGVDASVLDQRPIPDEKRGQAVGIPGEVAGLFALQQRFGKLAWRALVTQAAQLATRGFASEPHTIVQVTEHQQPLLARSTHFRSVYLPGGNPAALGQTLRSPRLAKTLTRIAAEGKRGFYEGVVANDIVKTVKATGGALTAADLAQYRVIEREPLRVSWGGKQVLTMPPPSAGGLLLAETLTLFQPAELLAMNDAPSKRVHLLAEAMRGASADRARFVGDPAFVSVDVGKLLAPARMARRKAHIAADRTHTQPRFGLEDAGTHHLVTADQDGNWVSMTTTVNDAFGAKLVADQSGIILNDQLADFTPPSAVAVFGLSENPNRVRAGARPVSSMSPTLVLEDDAPVAALGGSGGLTIAPNVTQVLLDYVVYGMQPEAAVSAPRFTIPAPSTGQTLWLEAALAQPYGADLSARGELLLSKDTRNAVQLVARRGGIFSAAADPRKQGQAAVSNAAGQ
jgi:gamma-glutamyltranspeptidase/glutathione hydrolase